MLHFFEGLTAGMVRDFPKTYTQSTLSPETFHPWEIPFQREFAFIYTHLAASRLPAPEPELGVSGRGTQVCGSPQYPSSSSRALEGHITASSPGLGLE